MSASGRKLTFTNGRYRPKADIADRSLRTGREGISYPSPIATLLLKSFACAARRSFSSPPVEHEEQQDHDEHQEERGHGDVGARR